jgi:hypothetical protein
MNNDALVLWLDMLGYKIWLSRQTNLEQAESALKNALKVAFRRLGDLRQEEPEYFDIESILISDTIILWSYRLDPKTFTTLTTLYHILHCELTTLGLPLRGAISKGTLRVSPDFPYTIVGSAIVSCALLEPQIKAFAVAVDDSVMEFVRTFSDDEAAKYVVHLSTLNIHDKDQKQEYVVLKWFSSLIPYSLLKHLNNLHESANKGDLRAFDDLYFFCPKLLNSKDMISSVILEEHREAVTNEWEEGLKRAENIHNQLLAELSNQKNKPNQANSRAQ